MTEREEGEILRGRAAQNGRDGSEGMKRREEIEIIAGVLIRNGIAEENEKTYKAVEEAIKEVRIAKWQRRKRNEED